MSASLLWIGLPIIVAILMWFTRSRINLSTGIAVGTCILLLILVTILPIGSKVDLGSVSFQISPVLNVLGRQFTLLNTDRSILGMIFGFASLWFLSNGITWRQPMFAPFGMAMIAALIAATAVEPYLYSALLIEVAILLSIPLLIPPGAKVKRGTLHYLIFQTLAMPSILFAGWIMGLVEANPADSMMINRAAFLIGLGFAFWLAVFPFNSWMPLLAKEAHPISTGFIFSFVPTTILLLILDFLNGFGWLRTLPNLDDVFRLVGVLMVVTSGLLSAFQKDLSRLFGYAVIFETGFALVAISSLSTEGLQLFVSAFIPRLASLLVFSAVLSVFLKGGFSTSFDTIHGIMQRFPISTLALLVAIFSIGGLPLLAGFPVRLEIFEITASLSLNSAIWLMVGNFGFLFAAVQVLTETIRGLDTTQPRLETVIQKFMASGLIFVLILFGILPTPLFKAISTFLGPFPNLLQ